MANAVLYHYDSSDTLQSAYTIEGLLNLDIDKSQQSIQLPFPFLDDSANVINSIFGQKREFSGDFIIMDRDDDYTNGTGSPSTKSKEEQKTWLMDDIFKPRGYHVIHDEQGNSYNGRIQRLRIRKAGDSPLVFEATFEFVRGVVPTAGQFDITDI